MFHIAIINEATSYKMPAAVIGALAKQVGDHFAPEWGTYAELRQIAQPSDKMAGEWLLAILDDSDQAGALGYHDLTTDGQPLGKVFARTTIQAGLNPTVTISHELLEMLADPDINLSCEIDNPATGVPTRFYAREVCDACEDDTYAYGINGVKVSDFVRRSWFIPGENKPYDYAGKIAAPLQLISGGYISLLNVATQGWTQVDAERAPVHPNIRSLARLEKRNKPRAAWVRSEHAGVK